MKKIYNFKRMRIAAILLLTALFAGPFDVAAVNNMYTLATEITGSYVDGYITSATQENWYKFTVSQVPAGFSVQLSSMPAGNPYSFEFRYQQTAGTRPVILNNEPKLNATATTKRVSGVLENAGTYYIRVFSLTGVYDSLDSYRLSVSTGRDTYELTLDDLSTNVERLDWAAASEVAGKYAFKRMFYQGIINRTYVNAAKFVQTSGAEDSTSPAPTNVRRGMSDTVTAVNYIYSGDFMTVPKFAESNTVYTTVDFLKMIWKNDRSMILYQEEIANPTSPLHAHYVVLKGANLNYDTITLYDPWDRESIEVDYVDYITNGYFQDGYETKYTGKSIIPLS